MKSQTHTQNTHTYFFLSKTPIVMRKRLNITFVDTMSVVLNLALWMLRHREEIYWHRLGRKFLTPHRLSGIEERRKIIQHLLCVRIFTTAYFGLILRPSSVSLQVYIQKVWPMVYRLPDDGRTIFQNKQQ
jgi:hypothetical protein